MEYHIEKSQPVRSAKELRGKRSSKARANSAKQRLRREPFGKCEN